MVSWYRSLPGSLTTFRISAKSFRLDPTLFVELHPWLTCSHGTPPTGTSPPVSSASPPAPPRGSWGHRGAIGRQLGGGGSHLDIEDICQTHMMVMTWIGYVWFSHKGMMKWIQREWGKHKQFVNRLTCEVCSCVDRWTKRLLFCGSGSGDESRDTTRERPSSKEAAVRSALPWVE